MGLEIMFIVVYGLGFYAGYNAAEPENANIEHELKYNIEMKEGGHCDQTSDT